MNLNSILAKSLIIEGRKNDSCRPGKDFYQNNKSENQ